MKILFYLRALNIGGAETFIYNILEKINLKVYSIDIVLQSENNENKRLMTLCEEKGVNIYYIPPFEKSYFDSYNQLLKLVRQNSYDIIHYHANSLINNIPLFVAKRCKCHIVIHSHNSSNNIGGIIGKVVHYINRGLTYYLNVTRLSCSEKAGKWMFGKKTYQIINNGINLNSFSYDAESRVKLRQSLSINDNTIVWGHIGRFVQAKNHHFLIKCFEEYNLRVPLSKLILIGDGPLFSEIKSNNRNANIIFLGTQHEISKYYSMFDVMVFPSLFEGLPFVLVEAQASGLPILASDNITHLVNVSHLIKYESLSSPISKWIENIPAARTENQRLETMNLMKNTSFDSTTTVQQLVDSYYLSLK